MAQAKRLAAILSEDDRLDVVDYRVSGGGLAGVADVFLVAAPAAGDSLPRLRPTVVLSDSTEPRPLGNWLRAWLPMSATPAEINAAIVAAASDLVVFTQIQAKRLAARDHPAHPDEDLPVEGLTARELQVLRMLSDGLGNKEIAVQLGISDHTAKFHVAQILGKLGARSRAEAVSIGIRRGLVPV
ncbi:MAG TPA: response regulator transcription factor [Bryobacteraceae bacterium]|nr:response regulator transcription factor [Bryobacteraceae bacterium]